MMQQFVWNAFSDAPFTGNPAAIIPLRDDWLPEQDMLALAAQNNLAETAFFVPIPGKEGHYRLRWFTPELEMDLCGHATLATAATIHHIDPKAPDRLTFETLSGQLFATRKQGIYELDFPVWQPHPTPVPNGLVAAIGNVPIVDCQMNRRDLLLELSSADVVKGLKPDFASLARLECDARSIIVTAGGGDDCDFVSRFFAPAEGIAEDPVTGSAHCGLIPYWAAKLGKTDMIARQVSARGGLLTCGLHGDRVSIGGQISLFLEGRIHF